MARPDIRIEWKKDAMGTILRSQGMHAIMEHFGKQVCDRANQRSNPRAKYGMKVTQGTKMRAWKARIYTANIVAMRDARKHNTLTKVL